MGFINNLAGAGGLVGLAGLDLAGGPRPDPSLNASLRPAAVGVCLGGVFGFVSKGQARSRRGPGCSALATVPGAVLGALPRDSSCRSGSTALRYVVVIVLTLAQQLRARRRSSPPKHATIARPRRRAC